MKKTYEIVKRKDFRGNLNVDGREIDFKNGSVAHTSDEGLLKEVNARFGDHAGEKVLIIEKGDEIKEPGHNYTFAGIQMPWHKYDENGKRIK